MHKRLRFGRPALETYLLCPDGRTRRHFLHHLALGPGLLRDSCLGSEVDYVGRNSQRKVGGFCRVSSPLRLGTLVSRGVAPPKITVSGSLKLLGGRYDQVPGTSTPRATLHHGISEPPRSTSDRMFVFAWLGGITFVAGFFLIFLYYIIPFIYLRH